MIGSITNKNSLVGKAMSVFTLPKIMVISLIGILIMGLGLYTDIIENIFISTAGFAWLYIFSLALFVVILLKVNPKLLWKLKKITLLSLLGFIIIYVTASFWQSVYQENSTYAMIFGGWIYKLGEIHPVSRLFFSMSLLLLMPVVLRPMSSVKWYYQFCIITFKIFKDGLILLTTVVGIFTLRVFRLSKWSVSKIPAMKHWTEKKTNLTPVNSQVTQNAILDNYTKNGSTQLKTSKSALIKKTLIRKSKSNVANKVIKHSGNIQTGIATVSARNSGWQLPTSDLLMAPERKTTVMAPLEKMARVIEQTLLDHGVQVEVKDIKSGPRIVRFGLVPGWALKTPGLDHRERNRVKVQSIVSREKDLALALQTPYIRIEAPVPGEPIIGIEVPNPIPSKVPLGLVTESDQFRVMSSKGGLPIALGQDTGGESVSLDLSTLPHLLIAGSTGSGKSVCINSLVASLLLTHGPDTLRMLMIDPKRVELTPFNGLPHLVKPVIVDTDEVSGGLKGLMREMFRRYRLMEDLGCRNIAGYNKKVKNIDRLPFLILIVDELADLMMSASADVEHNLVRLAQLGRATGIHLVLATQRPSVQVVTGLLKANIPGRVAFAVASNVDSRVILDTVGAEKLLGQGDMLLLSSSSPKPRRVQGTLVSDNEIDSLVKYWARQRGPELMPLPMDFSDDDDEQNIDEKMLEESRKLALKYPNLSRSHLERQLRIGATKADSIIDILEEEGLVNLSF
ncbi:MAG TPA: hypothetical protein DEZ08_08290 [Dehalococcoidia bacterium]|nr:hypothetical protein [Dehalococcoidia bacterium]